MLCRIIAEQVILSRPFNDILELTHITDEQFGFHSGLSVDLQTFRLSEAIQHEFSNKETTALTLKMMQLYWRCISGDVLIMD